MIRNLSQLALTRSFSLVELRYDFFFWHADCFSPDISVTALSKGESGMETHCAMLRSTSQEGTRSHFGLEANLAYAHYGSASAPGSGFVGARNFPIKLTMVLLLMSSIFMGVRSAGAAETPAGTIELSGGSVAAGVGYTWGNGMLIFEGKKYPIKVQGISVVHVGLTDYTASGTVYNLKKLSDINGVYTAVSAGAALAGGASATAMENSHGVVIQMVATHAGVNLSLGPKGVAIKL
jgi:hypothetical protein